MFKFKDFQQEMIKSCKEEIKHFHTASNGNSKKFYELCKILLTITNEIDKLPVESYLYQIMSLISGYKIDSTANLELADLEKVFMAITEEGDNPENLKKAIQQFINN
jgi:hypothetical protein